MSERAIEAMARPLRWKLADAISFAVTNTYGHASDYLVEADAALSVIAALAEDDAAVERSMKAVLKAWRQAGVSASPELEASEIAARAAIAALLKAEAK